MRKDQIEIVSLMINQDDLEKTWFLKDSKSPETLGGQYFRGKCWKSEAEAREWLNTATLEDIFAIRGEKI